MKLLLASGLLAAGLAMAGVVDVQLMADKGDLAAEDKAITANAFNVPDSSPHELTASPDASPASPLTKRSYGCYPSGSEWKHKECAKMWGKKHCESFLAVHFDPGVQHIGCHTCGGETVKTTIWRASDAGGDTLWDISECLVAMNHFVDSCARGGEGEETGHWGYRYVPCFRISLLYICFSIIL